MECGAGVAGEALSGQGGDLAKEAAAKWRGRDGAMRHQAGGWRGSWLGVWAFEVDRVPEKEEILVAADIGI